MTPSAPTSSPRCRQYEISTLISSVISANFGVRNYKSAMEEIREEEEGLHE
jgi:hypothetical protein